MSFRTLATRASAVAHRSHRKTSLSPLIFITDRHKIKSVFNVVSHLPPGAMVIVRDYDHPNRKDYALSIKNLCHKQGCHMLIAGDPELAAEVGADGVHLPEPKISMAIECKRQYPRWIMTSSAHSLKAIKRAACFKVDALLVSPVFVTSTHPGIKPLGVRIFNVLSKKSTTPVYALGGVNASNILRLRHAKITGIAAIDGFNI